MSVFHITPTTLTDSSRQFVIPETIMSDYTNYLLTEVPNAVFDFRLLHSWYDQFDEQKNPIWLRAEHFPINWKSKVGNSDMNKNFYTDYSVPIRKGDMVIREDGMIGMLNWSIQHYINAQTTQVIECNHRITVIREVPATSDEDGYLIHPAHDETIVDSLPCVISEYAGRPDYTVALNSPGIHPDMLISLSMQWNERTENVRISDKFIWGCFTYRIVNINYDELELDRRYGVVKFNARRVAGETY